MQPENSIEKIKQRIDLLSKETRGLEVNLLDMQEKILEYQNKFKGLTGNLDWLQDRDKMAHLERQIYESRQKIGVNQKECDDWNCVLEILVDGNNELILNDPEITIDDHFFNLLKNTNISLLSISRAKLSVVSSKIGHLVNLANLSITQCKIKNLPPEIGQLTNLISLDLSRNQLTNLPADIGKLLSLELLDIHGNQLNYLPPEIGALKNLRVLNLNSNDFTHLQIELSNLSNLEELYLNFNRLLTLPHEIVQLRNLKILELIKNNLTFIQSTINRLENLIELNLGGNPMALIPAEIGSLSNLEKLHLDRTQVKELPVSIGNLQKLRFLDLGNTQLRIPLEILGKVEEPQVILNYYFAQLTGNKKPLSEAKIIIVGQGSVGKTSLVNRLLINKFSDNQMKTEGISVSRWHVDNQSEMKNLQAIISLNLWDFGGQEIMHATHQFFLTKRSLYLLVLDSRLTQEENRVEYWLKIIQSFGGESPVLIVGNKIDQHPLDIDRTGLQKKYPNIVGILETSAATGAGIEELKAAIAEQVNNLPHVRDLLPETWFTVKTKLEELGRQSNFITHDKYLELCAENEVSDETSQRTLIGFLHDLGVVLHFQDDPRLEALGILNPQWVTNGVYKILNSHTLFQNKGVLTVSMLDDILNLPEYPRGKRLFIVDMMKKFELCYDIESDKTFLVPDLLPKDQPELKFNGVPAFEYAYPVLPSSVITRFIVRMNQKIDDGFVWRTGVVLKIGENKALVKADIEDRKITIAIDGVEHTRRDALSAIRYQLDEIHSSIKGLDAQKFVPVSGAEPQKYEFLLKLERDGVKTLPVPGKNGNEPVMVDISQILSGVESEAKRREQTEKVVNNYISYVGGDVHTDGGDFTGRDKSISASDRSDFE